MSTHRHEEPAPRDYFTPAQDAAALAGIFAINALFVALVVAVGFEPQLFLSLFF